MSNKISLNGYPCVGNVTWTQTSGPGPSQAVVEMESSAADAAWKAGSIPLTSTLEIIPDGGGNLPLKVEALSIIDYAPSGNPFTKSLVVVDRRWLWSRKHVLRRYNIRRRTGQVSVLRDDTLRNVTSDIVKVGYAVWSLDGNEKWTAQRVISDIMAQIDPKAAVVLSFGSEKGGGPRAGGGPEAGTGMLTIENLEIDDSGENAVSRALMQIPGLTCTVERTGTVRFFNTLDGSEGNVISIPPAGDPPVVGAGYPIASDHSRIRPREIVVYFTKEMECRFDFTEVFGTTASKGIPVAQLENVLPVTDPELSVGGRTVGRGTYITFDEAYAAWEPTKPPGFSKLDAKYVRDNITPLIALNPYRQAGDLVGTVDWSARIDAVLQNYHVTYRIPQNVMQRIYQFRENRVAIIDPVNGVRAPSPVWMDYSLDPGESPRWVIVEGQAGDDVSKFGHGRSVKGYSDALNNGKIAPVSVNRVDEDQGIIHLSYRGDYLGAFIHFIPGNMLNMPRATPTTRFPRFYCEERGQNNATLDPTFGMSTILTVAFGAPNDNRQLKAITVAPQEAEELIPRSKFTPATGPPVQLRVGPGIVTARFAWQDIKGMGAAVRQTIGLEQGGDSRSLGFINDVHLLDSQWINQEDCVLVAKAIAAAYYAYLTDRTIGDKTTGLNPFVALTGAITSVQHAGHPDGSALTTASSPQFPSMRKDPFALLPDKVRNIVMRLVQFP